MAQIMSASSPAGAALAAHRFGLGEATLDVVGGDPLGWLETQVGPADAARGEGLLSTAQGIELIHAEAEKRRLARNPPPGMTAEQVLAGHYRETLLADGRSRLVTASTTQRPFAERLQLFWTNHFAISAAKGSTRGLVGAFERDAIRPNIAGSFEALLWASTTHPAMLRYLDNHLSAGPHSRVVARAARRAQVMQEGPRVTGLNENLAREVLELHTLGVNGGYAQADVTAFAALLTGWRIASGPGGEATAAMPFDPAWHEPGRKTVLGRSYPEGPDALRRVLADLARHPSTARFLATKLARHFVADDPPAALVDQLAAAYTRSDGQLPEVYRALLRSPEAWSPEPAKLKTPEEFVIASARVLDLGERAPGRNAVAFNLGAGIAGLGQRPMSPPSPAGWPDRAEDWLGPDAVWKRIEWSNRVGDRLGRSVDARALARASLGPLIGAASLQQIDRAADGPQALALLLMAPEFQRR
jgi:uncharacterized protein (DUF1800 family)